MKKIIFIASILLFATLATPLVFANQGEKNTGGNQGFKFNLFIKNDKNEIKANSDNKETEIEAENKNIEKNKNRFLIRGKITSVSGNTFTVSGESITIDLSKVSKFKQKGILNVDKYVKIKGIILEDKKYAEQVIVKKNKTEVEEGDDENDNEINPTPTVSPAVSPTATVSPTITTTPSVTPSTNPAPLVNAKIKIQGKGSIEELIETFENLLSYLKSLV